MNMRTRKPKPLPSSFDDWTNWTEDDIACMSDEEILANDGICSFSLNFLPDREIINRVDAIQRAFLRRYRPLEEARLARINEELRDERAQRDRDDPVVECDCGHTERRSQVMSTSNGSSCVDCYDRMELGDDADDEDS